MGNMCCIASRLPEYEPNSVLELAPRSIPEVETNRIKPKIIRKLWPNRMTEADPSRIPDPYECLHHYEECIQMKKDRSRMIDPASCAAVSGHVKCLKELLKEGADVNYTDEWGNTALSEAKRKRHHECVDFLLKQKLKLRVDRRSEERK